MQAQQEAKADAKLQSQQLEQQAQEVAHQKQELAQQEAQLASSKLQLEVRSHCHTVHPAADRC